MFVLIILFHFCDHHWFLLLKTCQVTFPQTPMKNLMISLKYSSIIIASIFDLVLFFCLNLCRNRILPNINISLFKFTDCTDG